MSERQVPPNTRGSKFASKLNCASSVVNDSLGKRARIGSALFTGCRVESRRNNSCSAPMRRTPFSIQPSLIMRSRAWTSSSIWRTKRRLCASSGRVLTSTLAIGSPSYDTGVGGCARVGGRPVPTSSKQPDFCPARCRSYVWADLGHPSRVARAGVRGARRAFVSSKAVSGRIGPKLVISDHAEP